MSLIATPVTWNVVGLDSNNVSVGPNVFPVGARVCNSGAATTNVEARFVWDDSYSMYTTYNADTNPNPHPYINLRDDTQSSITLDNFAASPTCKDFYFEVEVNRLSASYDKTRRYHIEIYENGAKIGSTVTPREIYVEHLVSQNRNSIIDVKVGTQSVPAGGSMTLMVGSTYDITLTGATSTGYNQLESFLSISNTYFRINSVSSTYSTVTGSAPASSNTQYANSCGWDNDPLSATYRSCIVSDDKSGGTVVVTYNLTILKGSGSNEQLMSMFYDYSGSSYHYNADYSVKARTVSIVSPVDFSKKFDPVTTSLGGATTLYFTLNNPDDPSDATASAMSFSDPLPAGMRVASGLTASQCGGTVSYTSNTVDTINFSGGSVADGANCTISVPITAPATAGTYTNTSGNLFVNGVDTNVNTVASLTVQTAPATSCTPVTIASWSNLGTTAPPTVTTTDSGVTAVAYSNNTSSTQNITSNYWRLTNASLGSTLVLTDPYYRFQISTSIYTNVKMTFTYITGSTSGPRNFDVYYGNSGTVSTTAPINPTLLTNSAYPSGAKFVPSTTAQTVTNLDFTGLTNTAGDTYFFLYPYNASNNGTNAWMGINNITFTGCRPAQSLTKTFSPNPILSGSTSTLTFNLLNYNTVQASSVAFSDSLPSGLTVSGTPTASQCGGTVSVDSSKTIIGFTGGSIPAKPAGESYGSCAVSVAVTGTVDGTYTNTSGYLSVGSTTINSQATAALTIYQRPEFLKTFSDDPIYTTGSDSIFDRVSTLTLRMINPNSVPLTLGSPAFTDTLPTNLLIADTPNAGNDCGGTVSTVTTSTPHSFSLSGGTIPANGSCTAWVDVSSAVANAAGTAYSNNAGVLTTTVGGYTLTSTSGTAVDTLAVIVAHPGISLSKQVASSASGPWKKLTIVTPGSDVYYRLTVENIGDVDLSSVRVSDPTANLAGCSLTTAFTLTTADPVQSCIVGPFTAGTGDFLNTATVQGAYGATKYTATSTAEYLGANPGLSLVKQVGSSATGPWYSAMNGASYPGQVYYKFTIVNTGGTALTGLNIQDNHSIDTSGCEWPTSLASGGATSCVRGGFATTVGTTSNTAYVQATASTANDTSSSPSTAIYTAGGYSISGLVWLDVNGDGLTTSESGIYNVTLALYQDSNGNGTYDAGTDIFLGNQYTDADGSYTFSSLPTGTYFVDVTNGVSGLSLVSGTDPRKVEILTGNSADNNFGYQSPTPDLKITKTNTISNNAVVGAAFTWTLTVSNTGTAAAAFSDGSTLLSDQLPTGATYANLTPTTTDVSGTVNCTLDGSNLIACKASGGVSIPAGKGFTVTVDATPQASVIVPPATTGTLANTASVDPGNVVSESQESNNSATNTVTVSGAPTPDLTVTKSNSTSDNKVVLGNSFDWTLTVKNAGTAAATFLDGATIVKDTLPSGPNYGDPSAGNFVNITNSDGVSCTVVSLVLTCKASGKDVILGATTGAFTVTLSVTPQAAGTLTNSGAEVDPILDATNYPNGAVSNESNESNNTSGSNTVTVIAPDLTVNKANTVSDKALLAEPFTWTVTVTNAGDAPAEFSDGNAILTDTLPGGITYGTAVVDDSGVTGNIVCPIASGSINCTASGAVTIGVGESFTVSLDVTPTSAALADPLNGSITNRAEADPSGQINESDETNNVKTNTVAVLSPDLTIAKTSGSAENTALYGGYFNWTLTVTNSGNGAANFTGGETVLSDTLPGGPTYGIPQADFSAISGSVNCEVTETTPQVLQCLANGDTSIPAGKSLTVSLKVTPASKDSLVNTDATVDPDGNVTESNDDNNKASNTVTVLDPIIQVTKSANATSITAAGQVVTYTIDVSNPGEAPLSGVTVSDAMCATGTLAYSSGDTDKNNILALSETWVYTCTHTVTQAEVDAGGNLTNTVTADSTESPADTYELDIPITQTPALTLTKSSSVDMTVVAPSDRVDAGDKISYSFNVENSGNVTVTNVNVSDPLLSSLSCTAIASLAPGDSKPLSCTVGSNTYTLTQADVDDGTKSNTATASGTGPSGTVSDSDTKNTSLQRSPALTLDKTTTATALPAAGGSISYHYSLTNSGNVTLYPPFQVSDDKIGSPAGTAFTCNDESATSLTVGASLTCTSAYTVTSTDFDTNKSVTNTASATAKDAETSGNTVTSATDSVTVNRTELTLTKSSTVNSNVVTPDEQVNAGDTVTYSFSVENTGSVTVTNITLGDSLLSGLTCDTIASLAAGASQGFNCTAGNTYTLKQTDIDAGKVSNTATATGKDPANHDVTDGATKDTSLTKAPALTLTKSSSVDMTAVAPSGQVNAGDTISYSFSVQNTGNVTVTSIKLTDTLLSTGLSCTDIASLAPGETKSFSCSNNTYTLTQTDVNAGTKSNTATASGKDPGGNDVSDGDTKNTALTQSAALTLTKSSTVVDADTNGKVNAGDTIDYTFSVENTGNVTVTNINVSDPLLGSLSCTAIASLLPGESKSLTCTEGYSYTLTQADIDAGTKSNTATASGKDPGDTTVSDTDTKATTLTQSPALTLTKSSSVDMTVAAPSEQVNAGDKINYTFSVENTGNVTVTAINVSDPSLGSLSCTPIASLAPGASQTLSCTGNSTTLTQDDLDAGTKSNTATASGKDPKNANITDGDTKDTTLTQSPALTLTKSSTVNSGAAGPSDQMNAGDTITYSFSVKNTGNVTVTAINVSDLSLGSLSCTPIDSLAPGETKALSCSGGNTYTLTQADLDAGKVRNTATASGSDPKNAEVKDDDTLDTALTQAPAIQVVKTADAASITDAGQTVMYTFTVTNTGNQTLTSVAVSDPKCDTDTLTGPDGDTNTDEKLDLSETWTYSCTHTVTQAEVDAGGNLSNTVSVSTDQEATDDDTLDIPITQSPVLNLTKEAAEGSYNKVGEKLHFQVTAQNTGNVTLTGVTITDAQLTGLSCSPAQPASLAPGEELVCTGTYTIVQNDIDTGSYKNSASVTGNPPSGGPVSDEADATVTADQISRLGLAKRIIQAVKEDTVAGVWDLTYEIVVKNYGNVGLTNVQVVDDLTKTFATPSGVTTPTTFIVISISSSDFTVNSGFNGITDTDLLQGSDSLGVNQSGKITFSVQVIPSTTGPFENTAGGSAIGPDESTVTDNSQTGGNPDPDGDGNPGNNSTSTSINFSSNIFDPPMGEKTFTGDGRPLLAWKSVWINNSNIVAVNVRVTDPIPSQTTFYDDGVSNGYALPADAPAGSTNNGVTCVTPAGSVTTTTYCYYEGPTAQYPRGQIIWQGSLGTDLGATDETSAQNEMVIRYSLSLSSENVDVVNVASLAMDVNGNGVFTDPGEANIARAVDERVPEQWILPKTGFAQGSVTTLPDPLPGQRLVDYPDMSLEISKLGVKTSIVGVPEIENGWDVSWLGSEAGWLNGTEFPTWMGNSVITGHVWDANNRPGIFANLRNLAYGDQIVIHAFGSDYVYAVRESGLVSPDDTKTILKSEDRSWVTLMTCEGYNDKSGQYSYRRYVRAVLVAVK